MAIEDLKIITCVDILGYKELLRRNDQAEINEVNATVDYFVSHNQPEESNMPSFKCKSYTDNFLFYYPIYYEDDSHNWISELYGDSLGDTKKRTHRALFKHVYMIAATQFDLCANNLFIRGGMTIGQLHIGSNVSGAGLLSAHDLEEKAVYPRIVVDQQIVNEYFSNECFPRIPLIKDANDGFVFIDFLFAALLKYNMMEYHGWGRSNHVDKNVLFLAEAYDIGENIMKGCSLKSERVRQKYLWLAAYYNDFIARTKSKQMTSIVTAGIDRSQAFETI